MKVLLRSKFLIGGSALALFSYYNRPSNNLFPSSYYCASPNYTQIREEIKEILAQPGYDFGHIGPVLVRLGWHASGTYSKADKTGGSNGATMRFKPEMTDGANAGLDKAREFLEGIKKNHPEISYADLWILASYVAIEEMGGPAIEFTPGRTDSKDQKACPPNGRLPDASKDRKHVRDVFYRMGFNDREIVALIGGGHALGKCHKDRSGYEGPWTNAPLSFSNLFFKELLDNKWTEKKWGGPKQYEDPKGRLMMLPTDIELRDDPEFRKWAELYKKDEEAFFKDFAAAFKKLTELGFKQF